MHDSDELIRSIVDESHIPSTRTRRAVARELRSHLEDALLAARETGLSDDEIRRQILARFGDPGQVARGFAFVYRGERTALRVATFVFSTLAVAVMLSAGVLAMQAGVALGFGAPVRRVIASRHTLIEVLDILTTVAAYLGLISMEKIFGRHRFIKAFAVLALIFATAEAGCAVTATHAPFLAFGFVSGVFLRTIQIFMQSGAAQTVAALAWFVAGGLLFLQARPSGFQHAVALSYASWLVMGAGYRLMAGLAPRVDEAMWKGLERIQDSHGTP